ncbi:MAG: bicyclomycin resistance protein [Burkholderiales bacterium]|nr:bicyclomycin resistance protein [Burkholderiales bacterium]
MQRRHLLAGLPSLPWLAARAAGGGSAPKTLHIAFPAPETSFDPVQTNSDRYSSDVISQILEAPLGYDYLARPTRLVPITAAALPEISADYRRIVVRLKPGILFADDPAFKGRPRELVAADYVYSIKRFFDPRWKSGDLYLFENAGIVGMNELRERALKSHTPFDYDGEVEGLRALDRYSFQVLLKEPQPRFVYLLAQPAYAGAMAREVVALYGDDIGAHPVGTGAYRLGAWRRSSRIVLERSPSFRPMVYEGQPADTPQAQAIAKSLAGRRLPLADRLQIDIIEEQQPRWLSFVNGQLDLLEVPGGYSQLAAPNGQLAPFLVKRGVQMDLALQPDMSMSFFNGDDPVVGGLAPERVALRRALALSHSSAEWARLVRGGFAIPAQSVVQPFTFGYEADYRSEMSEYNPAKARALLDLYGYVDRDGDGWRELPDGTPFTLRIASLQDIAQRRANELWQRSLDAIGVRVRFEIAGWPELLKKARSGSLQIWGYAWSATSPDCDSILGTAYGPNATEVNDAHFALPAYDRLYERQRRLPDGPERAALILKAKNLLVAYMPYKVHGHRIQADLSQPWVRSHWRHPFMRDIYRFVDVEPH